MTGGANFVEFLAALGIGGGGRRQKRQNHGRKQGTQQAGKTAEKHHKSMNRW
jgi:hypothetical protein